ncbi:MAG: polysaccharide deacetylase family protein [Clostridia bacterium]|nr:polysaccharide deacetylase family protein [Clostridia bacterium]
MKQYLKPVSGFVLALLVVLLTFLTAVFAAGGADEQTYGSAPGGGDIPTLFYNDTAWSQDRYYPALGFVTGGTDDFWIPLSFIEEIADIRVRRGPSRNVTSFVISDTVTGKYLSFDTANSEYAQTERGTYLFIRTTLYSKERYLPMRDICAYFGWSFEISEDKLTVRITDGGQKKTFAWLLAQYAPEETDIPDTEPVTEDNAGEDDVPGYNIYRSDTVRLTFEDISDTHTPRILDILAEYGVEATFFVTGEQLLSHTDIVVRILSEGHSLGLHTMTGDEYDLTDTAAVLASFDAENELLYALTKQKTRLVRLPEGSHSGVLRLSDRQKQAIADAGYILWDWNIESMDTSEAYDADMVYTKIEEAMKISYVPVVRFHNTALTAEVLPRLLARIEEVPVITAKKITEATENIIFP